jgi:hypothetical protein
MMPKTLNLGAVDDPFGAGNHRENKLALQAKSPNIQGDGSHESRANAVFAQSIPLREHVGPFRAAKPCNDPFQKKCLTVSTYP